MRPIHTERLSAATVGLGLALALGSAVWGEGAPQGDPALGKSGNPLQPNVTVEHQGRLLVLRYSAARSGDNPYASAGPRGEPPQFTVYKGRHQVASGQFEYG
jgi:hypothetical protein